MKTNVSINLNDTERCLLADFIDNKKTKRLVTRAEIVALARSSIERVLIAENIADVRVKRISISASIADDSVKGRRDPIAISQAETPDPEDTEHLADKMRLDAEALENQYGNDNHNLNDCARRGHPG